MTCPLVPLAALLAVLGSPALAQVPLQATPELVYAAQKGESLYDPAFAVTDDGTVHILFYDTLSDELRYVHDAAGPWSAPPEVLSATSDVGPLNLEMDLGPDDRIHAVFDPGPGDVFGHAIRATDGTWTVESHATNARWMRLNVSPDGVVHGAYSNGGLQYGSDATGAWAFEEVRRNYIFAERSPVLVFEGPGTPAVGFVDRTDFNQPTVQLARKNGSTWDFQTVSPAGQEPLGMTRATDGTQHAVFLREDEDRVTTWVHATDAGGSWADEPVVLVGHHGVADGSQVDLALVDGEPLWADAQDGLRLILGGGGTYRTFLVDLEASTVRMRVVGNRLLLVAIDRAFDVYFLELPLTDVDGDGVRAAFDVCPEVADPGQLDADGDGVGDACNDAADRDGDEFADLLDNCPDVANPDQGNADRVETLAVLDLATDQSFEVEPGATLTFDASKYPAVLVASGAELACGACDAADFSGAVTAFEFSKAFCGASWYEHIGRSTFCVRAPATNVRFDLVLRSVVDPEGPYCYDADFGASCDAAGGLTSASFVRDDGRGDVCDCDDDDGQCTGWTDVGGYCDGSSPERLDQDCDLCVVGPDADGDGVTDACDTCPDDPDKAEPGTCGCGTPDVDPCEAASDDGKGCGCSVSGEGWLASGWLAGLLALVALRRRR